MKKIELNSKTLHKIADLILAKRSLFLIVFFGAILIYSFDIIYNNAYLKLEYIDYSSSVTLFDGRKESIMISKITDSLKHKEEIIEDGLRREHKNIFVYEDIQPDAFVNDAPSNGGNNTENTVIEETKNISTEEVGLNDGGAGNNPVVPDATLDEGNQQ